MGVESAMRGVGSGWSGGRLRVCGQEGGGLAVKRLNGASGGSHTCRIIAEFTPTVIRKSINR